MPERPRVLLTGGTGLLGSHVAGHLVRQGYDVRVFVRPSSNRRALEGIDCCFFEGNLHDAGSLAKALEGCHYVIHSAARTAQHPSRLEVFRETNIETTRMLLDLCRQRNIKRFVFVSTANCFTAGSLEQPGTEDSGFMPFLRKSGYALSKYRAQQEVLQMAREADFPAVVVAPTFLLGARDVKPSSGKLLLYALHRRMVFYPPGGKSFTDASSAGEAVVNALHRGRNGETYLLAGKNLSYRDFFRLLRKHTGKRQWLIPLPRPLLVVVASLFSLLEHITGKNFPFNRTNQRLLCLHNYFSPAKARRELSLRPTVMGETLEKVIRWFS